jgi:hypothetical protein
VTWEAAGGASRVYHQCWSKALTPPKPDNAPCFPNFSLHAGTTAIAQDTAHSQHMHAPPTLRPAAAVSPM